MNHSKSCNTKSIIITAIITSLIVGGGVYYHQKVSNLENKINEIEAYEMEMGMEINEVEMNINEKESEKPVAQKAKKSIVDYYNMRKDFNASDAFAPKGPEEAGFKTIGSFKTVCPEVTEGLCGGNVFILTKDNSESEIKEFYIGITGGAMMSYYGPFEDNLDAIVKEVNELGELEIKN